MQGLKSLHTLCLALAGGLTAAGAAPSALAAQAGRIQFVAGDVQIFLADGSSRPARKGDIVNENDTIVTAPTGSVQLRMVDDGLISVRPDSRLRIDEYRFSGREDGSERGVLGLIKGGFRTLTGIIGRSNKSNYLVRAPNATIGIRGTDHEPFYIAPPGPGEVATATPGTYNQVNVGETFIETPNGRIELGANQVGFAGVAPGVGPVRLDRIPDFMRATPVQRDRDERREVRSAAAVDRTVNAAAASRTSGTTEEAATRTINRTRSDTSATVFKQETSGGAVSLTQAASQVSQAPSNTVVAGGDLSGAQVGSGGLLVGVGGSTMYFGADGNPALISRGTEFSYARGLAPLADSGTAGFLDAGVAVQVRWGVYAGGVIADNAGTRNPAFFHFITAPGMPPAVAGGLTATYTNILAHSKFITETGSLGGSLNTVNISFNAGSLTAYNIALTDAAGRNWTGGFTGSVSPLNFATSGINLSGTGPGGGSSGKAHGNPIGPTGGGVVSSFDLKTTAGLGVTGVFAAK